MFLAAKYLNQGWEALSLLYVYEAMYLLQDKIVREIGHPQLARQVLSRLSSHQGLSPQIKAAFGYTPTSP